MRESRAKKAERITTVLRLLKETYPDAKPELDFNSPFELLVATMLSAQCTDKQVNKTTAVLFPKYGTPEAFAALTEEENGQRRCFQCFWHACDCGGYACVPRGEPHRPCGCKGCAAHGRTAHAEHSKGGMVHRTPLADFPRQALLQCAQPKV